MVVMVGIFYVFFVTPLDVRVHQWTDTRCYGTTIEAWETGNLDATWKRGHFEIFCSSVSRIVHQGSTKFSKTSDPHGHQLQARLLVAERSRWSTKFGSAYRWTRLLEKVERLCHDQLRWQRGTVQIWVARTRNRWAKRVQRNWIPVKALFIPSVFDFLMIEKQ